MIFNMAKVHFFLRSNNDKKQSYCIYCRLTYKGTKTEFSMGEKIQRKEWDQSGQKMKGNSPKAKFIKTLLERTAYNIKSHSLLSEFSSAKELMESMRRSSEPQRELIDFVNDYIESVADRIKPGTLRNHKIKLQNLVDYQKHRKQTFYPDNFTIPEGEKFKQWFQDKNETTNVTTATRNINFYRQSLEYAVKTGEIQSFPLQHFKGEKDPKRPNVFLTIDELQRIIMLKPDNIQLTRIKDIFLFQCYTGLSYGDIWSDWEVKEYDGQRLLEGVRSKNGQRYYVPLSNEALEIIHKYPEGLPRYHNVVVNRILKELAIMANIEKRITSHTGRKTFATIQDSLGWTRESVAKMLGHKSISTTEDYYLGESDQRILEEMRKVG